MLGIFNETVMSIQQAAAECPGGGVAMTTIWRWTTRGVRGVKLETVRKGWRVFTSREAVCRFFAALNNGQPGPVQQPEPTAQQLAHNVDLARRLAPRPRGRRVATA